MITQENRIMLPLQEEKIPSFVQEVLVGLGRIKKTWSTDLMHPTMETSYLLIKSFLYVFTTISINPL